MKNVNLLTLLFFAMALSIAHASCKHPVATSEDQAIMDEVMTSTLLYYQGNDVLLRESGNSPHGDFKLLFNQTAWDALDSTGRLPVGGTFPDGSLIVKDIVKGGSTDLYAVMLKKPSSGLSNLGWVWNEFKPNGGLVIGAEDKGKACVGCHRGNTNRDYTNSFDLH
jgi:hypothetical protein